MGAATLSSSAKAGRSSRRELWQVGGGINNRILVSDTGSVWAITGGGTLSHHGWNGQFDSIVISNGAQMSFGGAVELGANGGGNNNSILVTGSGSVLSNATTFNLGLASSGTFANSNSLTIAAGGKVVSVGLTQIGDGVGAGASNNSVLVTDSGSVLVE